MKITIERLRKIITEEVIKEELAPEIAAPAIAAMLQGMEAEATSDVFGEVFNQMYGEGALEDEAERQAGMEEPAPEDFPTGYQAGGAYGDRPKIGFKESLEKIIKHEFGTLLKEMYNFEDMSDSELVEQAYQDGIEEFIVLDGDGDLVNREEIIQALNNVDNSLDEDMASREDIAALRQRVGDMSYEIERMLVSLIKAGYSMEDIMQMASELKRMDPHPADVQVAERKLSKAEEKEKEKVVKGMKKSKKDFEKRYGDDAESVMYATATKMAKKKKE